MEGSWLSVTPLPHDIAYVRDFTDSHGRLHHIACWLDSREEVLRAADLLTKHDIFIEAGPAKHNISQAFTSTSMNQAAIAWRFTQAAI